MNRPDAPGPLRRRGPRPLLLHLTLAMLKSPGSAGISTGWNSGSPGWNGTPDSLLATWQAALAGQHGGASQAEAGLSLADPALLAGVAAYRRHPYERALADPPAIWTEGESRILDYGAIDGATPGGVPVLFVPSLVNRAYILDLAPGQSLLRHLAGAGIRPLLLDWGWPGAAERRFNLTDYVTGRLLRAMAAARKAAGGGMTLAGYCMGGLLAVAALQARPELAERLVLLATPWDFHAEDADRSRTLARLLPMLEAAMAPTGRLPIDKLQTLFALLDPDSIARKYRAFGGWPQDGAKARLFVALEDWLNDGVPLAAPVARDCLGDWYGANAPAADAWRVAGLPVVPSGLRHPSFIAIPDRDRIVPPASALALAAAMPQALVHRPAAGHVGMVAGSNARTALWEPLAHWLRDGAAPM